MSHMPLFSLKSIRGRRRLRFGTKKPLKILLKLSKMEPDASFLDVVFLSFFGMRFWSDFESFWAPKWSPEVPLS